MKSLKAFCISCIVAGPALAQNLFLQQPAPMPLGTESQRPDAATPLYHVSLTAVVPPPPRAFKVHDLVTIIVDETSKQAADQQTKADKTSDFDAQLNAYLDPWALLQFKLQQSSTKDLALLKSAYTQKFDGKGTYTRNDSLTMKIQAEIIDVKPNGTMVVEARKRIDKNGETQLTVLSGVCRISDITQQNSVLSSQIADMTLVTKNDGEVNRAGKKGILTKIFDRIFAF